MIKRVIDEVKSLAIGAIAIGLFAGVCLSIGYAIANYPNAIWILCIAVAGWAFGKLLRQAWAESQDGYER